jgi:hypothetical protein
MVLSNRLATIPEACRDGTMFVLSPDATLPCRCIRCNADAPGLRLSKRISTLSTWYPLFSSAGWNAHCADECPIHITFSLCLRHRMEWLARVTLLGFVGVANIFFFVICKIVPDLVPITGALALFPIVLFMSIVLGVRSILRPRQVHHGLAWFGGAGPEFLDSLPQFNERSAALPEAASPALN